MGPLSVSPIGGPISESPLYIDNTVNTLRTKIHFVTIGPLPIYLSLQQITDKTRLRNDKIIQFFNINTYS